MKNKRRILYLGDKFTIGGGANMMRDLIREFKSDKYKMYFCYLRTIDSIKGLDRQKKENVFYLNDSKYGVSSLFSVLKIISKYKIDIVHANGDKSTYFLPIIKVFYPKCITIHHEHHSIVSKNLIYSKYLKLTRKFYGYYIAISKNVKELLMRKACINEKNIEILYNFIDLNKFIPGEGTLGDSNIENKISQKDFKVGFAARLIERKGWRDFLKASKELKDVSNLKFLIAGDGKDRDKIIQLIKKWGLENRVYSLGFIVDMNSFYNYLDCFVIPSHWEPLGLTELEAQACGVPVIASNVPGLNEVINDKKDALFFKPRNYHDLASKIMIIKNNKKLRMKLIKNGLKNVKKYSLTSYIKNLTKIYDGLLKAN